MEEIRAAINEGDHVTLKSLLRQQLDVLQSESELSETVLHYAIRKTQLLCFEELVKHGAKVNAVDNWKRTPLHWSALGTDNDAMFKMMSQLIAQGADVNARDRDNTTALHFTCSYGRLDRARLLLENSAAVDVRNSYGDDAIHYAARLHPDIVLPTLRLLVDEFGANPTSVGNHGVTPLMLVVSSSEKAIIPVVKYLLQFETEINRRNARGHTALFMALAETYNRSPIPEVVDLLCKHGADLNMRYECNGMTVTALMFELEAPILKVLLENGSGLPRGLNEFIGRDTKCEFIEEEMLLVAGVRTRKPWKHLYKDYYDVLPAARMERKRKERTPANQKSRTKATSESHSADTPGTKDVDDTNEEEGTSGKKADKEETTAEKTDESESDVTDSDEDDYLYTTYLDIPFPTLQRLCRYTTRCHLLDMNRNRNLFWLVPKITGLPDVLKKYLLYDFTYEED